LTAMSARDGWLFCGGRGGPATHKQQHCTRSFTIPFYSSSWPPSRQHRATSFRKNRTHLLFPTRTHMFYTHTPTSAFLTAPRPPPFYTQTSVHTRRSGETFFFLGHIPAKRTHTHTSFGAPRFPLPPLFPPPAGMLGLPLTKPRSTLASPHSAHRRSHAARPCLSPYTHTFPARDLA
jgi:hypothetical protein